MKSTTQRLQPIPGPDFADMTDAELLAKVVDRHAKAFEELYSRHFVAVASIVRQFTEDRIGADEAIQAAFLSLWSHADRLNPNSRLRSWLATVARNHVFSIRRRKRVDTVLLLEHTGFASDGAGPEQAVIVRERYRDVHTALESLPRDQRLVIELAYFGGLTQTEIATFIGKPLGTVKSRVRLAMQHLRASMVGKEDRYGPAL